MPWDKVMSKFGKGKLHSGSKTGKKVKNRKQAIAIMMSEKREASKGHSEYAPSESSKKKMMKGKM